MQDREVILSGALSHSETNEDLSVSLKSLGLFAVAAVTLGVFCPIITIPVLGSQNYFQNGQGDGLVVLLLATVSLVLLLKGSFRGVFVTGCLSLLVTLFTLLTLLSRLNDMQKQVGDELKGNPFAGLAQAAMQSVQIQWGWVLLIGGAGVLIYTGWAGLQRSKVDRTATVPEVQTDPIATVAQVERIPVSPKSAFKRTFLIALGVVVAGGLVATKVAISSYEHKVDQSVLQSAGGSANASSSPETVKHVSAPPSGSQWNFSTSRDSMGRALSFAVVESTNTLEFGFPYQGVQHGHLTIRKKSGHELDVYVRIEKGQFLCGIEDCTVNVRFDEGAIRHYSAVPPSDNSTTVLFIENATGFIAAMRKAKSVTIEPTFYQEGAQGLTFDVEGFKQP